MTDDETLDLAALFFPHHQVPEAIASSGFCFKDLVLQSLHPLGLDSRVLRPSYPQGHKPLGPALASSPYFSPDRDDMVCAATVGTGALVRSMFHAHHFTLNMLQTPDPKPMILRLLCFICFSMEAAPLVVPAWAVDVACHFLQFVMSLLF